MNRIYEKAPYKSLLRDKKVYESIRNRLEGSGGLESFNPADLEKLEGGSAIPERLDGGPLEGVPMDALEAIVLLEGRPSLFVQDGDYLDPQNEELLTRLSGHRANIKKAIKGVGRLDILPLNKRNHAGTAWRITEDILITNRHVAEAFAGRRGGRIVFHRQPNGLPYEADVDFFREFDRSHEHRFEVLEVLHIEPKGNAYPDMALVRIQDNGTLPPPLEIARVAPEYDQDVVVIGYPGDAPRKNNPGALERYFDGVYGFKRISPGRVSAHYDGVSVVFYHDCTTLGGNSGSVVLDIETGKVLGLHFAGEPEVKNWAVSCTKLLKRLDAVRTRNYAVPAIETVGDEETGTAVERITANDLADRTGYRSDFLGQSVPLPKPTGELEAQVTPVGDDVGGELKYRHYSIVMHKERRLAIFTACNIDGKRAYRITRGRDRWQTDPRIPEERQIDNTLYRNNPLDRGHLVRRLDPAWGDTREEADAAAGDTFFYTNAAPQHEKLNQRIWLGLEDYVLENADNHNIRVSVFTGPVFKETDRVYRNILIPESFWKVLAFLDRNGRLSATGYLLTQSDFLNELEFVYGAYETYQVPVADLAAITGLDFGALVEADPLNVNREEGAGRHGHRISSLEDLIL
jgi:endonuclease G